MIILAVRDALARAHALDFPRNDHRACPHAVLVLKGAFQNISNDLHVPVSVRGKTFCRLDGVLVEDPERAKAHPLRVVVMGEGKRVVGVEPAVIEMAALGRFTNRYHKRNPITFPSRGTSSVVQLLEPENREDKEWQKCLEVFLSV